MFYLRRILLLFFVFLSCSIQAQTKILFDATKAEMASNADWVIDADSYTLFGNEANPQRFPTPEQATVDTNTTQDYWKGALSAWAIDAVKLGYSVETLPNGASITYNDASNIQDLSNYTIFVICEPNISFTSAEKTAIMLFVQNGGGLFMISDHDNSDRNGDGVDSVDVWNDFLQNNTVQNNPFGISFDYEYFTEATTNIPTLPSDPLLHGSYGDVTSVEFYGGTSMTLNTTDNTSVKGIVYRTGFNNTGNTGVLCAYASYGQGKVVALGDSSPPDDGSGDPNDNLYDGWITDANGNHERLIMNASIWLSQTNTASTSSYTREDLTIFYHNNKLYITPSFLSPIDITITDVLGKNIYTKKHVNSNNISLILKENQLYFYQLKQDHKIIKTGKILVSNGF